jgi:hypothetical protein
MGNTAPAASSQSTLSINKHLNAGYSNGVAVAPAQASGEQAAQSVQSNVSGAIAAAKATAGAVKAAPVKAVFTSENATEFAAALAKSLAPQRKMNASELADENAAAIGVAFNRGHTAESIVAFYKSKGVEMSERKIGSIIRTLKKAGKKVKA